MWRKIDRCVEKTGKVCREDSQQVCVGVDSQQVCEEDRQVCVEEDSQQVCQEGAGEGLNP